MLSRWLRAKWPRLLAGASAVLLCLSLAAVAEQLQQHDEQIEEVEVEPLEAVVGAQLRHSDSNHSTMSARSSGGSRISAWSRKPSTSEPDRPNASDANGISGKGEA